MIDKFQFVNWFKPILLQKKKDKKRITFWVTITRKEYSDSYYRSIFIDEKKKKKNYLRTIIGGSGVIFWRNMIDAGDRV